MRRLASLILLSTFAVTPVAAQSVQALGDFRDWAAYSASDGSGQVCFALSKPTDVSPPVDGYTQAYLYLTNRPTEGVSNEVNLVAGFNFAPDQPATCLPRFRSSDGDQGTSRNPSPSSIIAKRPEASIRRCR